MEGTSPNEEEDLKLTKDIVIASMKSDPFPSSLIMTINMNKNAEATGEGIANDQRMLLKIILQNAFPSLVFCQELPGRFDEVVTNCGTGGFTYVKTGKQAAVMWLEEEFDSESVDTKDRSIIRLEETLRGKRSDVDTSVVLTRIAMVILKKKGEEADGCLPFLAASWHGPWLRTKDDRCKVFKGLILFLREVCKAKKVFSFIIGGDFNLNTEGDIDILDKDFDNMIVPSYNLTSRAEGQTVPYKDNFIFVSKGGIWVSSVKAFEFENSTDPGSDITKKDHEKFNEKKQSANERRNLLDHDPIVGKLLFKPSKQTGECKLENVGFTFLYFC